MSINKIKKWLPLSKRSHYLNTSAYKVVGNQPVKVLVMSIVSINAAMLTACQSTHTPMHAQASHTLSNNIEDIQLFNIDHNQPSSAQRSKEFLLAAINSHLSHEYTAVSQLRYHASPYVGVDDIESNDDSLFKTFLKVREFQRQKYGYESDDEYDYYDYYEDYAQENAFRSEEDYLADDSIDTYLRYDDEIAGTLPFPNYDMSKETAFTEDYRDTSSDIYTYIWNSDDCLTTYSIGLDDLLENEPEIDSKDERIAQLKSDYESCNSTVKEDHKQTIEAATGYPKQYIETQNSCMTNFHQQIDSLLSPERSIQSISYDEYDSIYQTYHVCNSSYQLTFDLEPINYVDRISKQKLDSNLQHLQCTNELIDGHQKLDSADKTYATDPGAHASLYYNKYTDCDYRADNIVSSDDDAIDSEQNPLDSNDVVDDEVITVGPSTIDTEGVYDVEDYEPEYASGDEKFEHDLANLDFQSFLADYREMKEQEDSMGVEDIEDQSLMSILSSARMPLGGLGSIRGMSGLNMLFGLNQNTPKQIDAQNYYAYHPLVIHSVSRYQPNQQLLSSVYSYDFDTPTLKVSMQMPVEFNFKQAKATLDPAALMPVMAMLSPKHTPTPDEIAGKVVTFELPEGMSKIPVGVFQQSFLKAIQQGLSTLNPEYFTDVDLSNDQFAKQVGATRGIKLYLGSKQSGELLGKILKHLSYDLKNYIDEHPNEFSEHVELKQKIDNWLIYNQGFQAKDVGSMLQVIEAVAPISFDQFNYFYFDASGRLIAKQNKTDVSSYLSQTNNSIVSQTRYDQAAFNASPYAKQLTDLFFDHRQSINGNQWKKSIDAKQALKDEARYARYGYDLPSFEEEYAEAYGYNDDDEEEIQNDAQSSATEAESDTDSQQSLEIKETKVITPSQVNKDKNTQSIAED